MPDRHLILHAGFHKTGTSSLQAALHTHAPHLAPLVRVDLRAHRPEFLQVCEAARLVSVNPAALPVLAAAAADWVSGLDLDPGQGLVASSEDLSGHMPGHAGLPDYRAALPIATTVTAALRRRFPHARLHLLYTTRSPEDWLRSIHWQLAKNSALQINVAKFRRRLAAAADFNRILSHLRAALPDSPIIDCPLETLSPRRLGPVEAIYDLLALPDALRVRLPVVVAANRSPPHDLAQIFIKLNRSDLPAAEIQRLKREMIAAAEWGRVVTPPSI